MMHVSKDVLDGDRIDPHKIDLVGRMGRSFYVRASGDAVMSLYQDIKADPIGYNSLPDIAKNSLVLTGNDIGNLAAITEMPSDDEISKAKNNISAYGDDLEHHCANLIAADKADEALLLLLAADK